MVFSLDQIKMFSSLDLDNFAIRGAKTGVNNAKSTGVLYDSGTYIPYKTFVYGNATVVSGDTTVTGISFNAPYASLTASDLAAGDTLIVRSDTTLSITNVLNSTKVVVNSAPGFSGPASTTCKMIDRDYLIEPDADNNSIIKGLAKFVNGSKGVQGTGTTWLSDLTSGDAIQLNTYQKYYLVNTVISDTSCTITEAFNAPTDNNPSGFHPYTAKRWRLNRLLYQHVKQNFTYDNNSAKWKYDNTTGSNSIAYSTFANFRDGINLKFSPTLKPASYPDLMDSNLVFAKTFSRSTENDTFQYPLPAVPNPEESFELYINDVRKDRFPDGNMDYVISYSQMPNYEYPPPIADRKVANLMFLKGIQNVNLNPANTSSGIINFTDASGNSISGIMPGSETILVDGTSQTANSNYVIDVDSGQAFMSEFQSAEPIVKYVMYQKDGLFDVGVNVTKNGAPQKLTIPGQTTDDLLFDLEGGTFKPIDKDNPGPGEEYLFSYYTEGEFISDEFHAIKEVIDWVRADSYPIKFQSVILSKNGVYLDENVDFRVSCLTGRVVFFNPLVIGDAINISYTPLIQHRNGLTYDSGVNFCTVYDAGTIVSSANPISIAFPNTDISGAAVDIQSIYNLTRTAYYNLTGYSWAGLNINLINDSTNVAIGTALEDQIQMTYTFENGGLEKKPVETINFFVGQNTNFMVLVNQDATSMFPPGVFIRMTNVDSAGDFYFQDASSVYDGEDTVVYFTGLSSSDINNPIIYISDSSSFTFNSVPVPLGIVSGTTDIKFSGDVYRGFRAGQLMHLDDDFYRIQGSSYDSSSKLTTVVLGVQTVTDYTTSGILSNVTISDIPVYFLGDTVIGTVDEIITDPEAPVMILNYSGYASVTKDSSAFTVDTGATHYTFLDSSYPLVSQLAAQIDAIPDFTVNVNAPLWQTVKISSFSNLTVTQESNTVVNAIPAVYYNSVDTTNYTIVNGVLTLNNSLVPGDRYSIDYLGLNFIGDSTVNFSGSYFTTLPAKSKISASMKYDNLDQFYVQVMGERNFLDTVIKPKKQEEASQQSGSVGQGGDLPGDDGAGNSQGGIATDEYRRVDTAIECKIFNTIFDFFNSRLKAYEDEYYASRGYKLCNNDGRLSETDQSSGALAINRMFPWADYTNFAPIQIACLTGKTFPYAVPASKQPNAKSIPTALFTNGSIDVTSSGGSNTYRTFWSYQLKPGDFIKPYDSSVDYTIATIVDDQHLHLTTAYLSPTVNKPMIMTSKFPLYDDDGHMGGKIIGTKSENFDLDYGDTFNVVVDGSAQSYTFSDPGFPINIFIPASSFTPNNIASQLTNALSGARVNYEWVCDPTDPFGYNPVFVVRTKGTKNKVVMGAGSAVTKFGFTPGNTSSGNFNISDRSCEYDSDTREKADINGELSSLSILLNHSNKMYRVGAGFSLVTGIQTYCVDEIVQANNSLDRIGDQTDALAVVLLEPSMAGYTPAKTALGDATSFATNSYVAISNAQALVSNYLGLGPHIWSLNILSSGQSVTGLSGQTSFSISITNPYDRRFLDATVNSIVYTPKAFFTDTGYQLDGTWVSWDPAGFNQYSLNNTLTFQLRNHAQPIMYLQNKDETYAYSYTTTASSIQLRWDRTGAPFDFTTQSFSCITYPTINSVKNAINAYFPLVSLGVTASGPVQYNGIASGFMPAAAPFSLVDATLYQGLRNVNTTYSTIDNKLLLDRSSYDGTRFVELTNRLNFIITRENQIKTDLIGDSYLRTLDGQSGNLYSWADNRFNRSAGCEAKLKQIEKQIQMNQSGLNVSQRFM